MCIGTIAELLTIYRELLFDDFGDRVAQLLHVELTNPDSQNRKNDTCQEILIANTHLLFFPTI